MEGRRVAVAVILALTAIAFAVDAAWEIPWWGWQIVFAAGFLVVLPGLIAQVRQKWKKGDRRYFAQFASGVVALLALFIVVLLLPDDVGETLLLVTLWGLFLVVVIQAIRGALRRR